MRLCVHLSCLLLLLTALPSVAIAAEKIKIGVSIPLTGPASNYGTDIKNILNFANHEVFHDRYEFVFEDDRCEGRDAVTVAHAFRSLHGVKYILGPACSISLKSAAPVYLSYAALVVTPTGNLEGVPQRGTRFFSTLPGDRPSIQKLFQWLDGKYKKVAVLTEQSTAPELMLDEAKKVAAELDIDLLTDHFLTGETDPRPLLTRLRTLRPDAVFINSQSEETFLNMLKGIRGLAWDVQIVGAYFPGSPIVREAPSALAEGIVFVDLPPIDRALNNDGSQLFRKFTSSEKKIVSIEYLFPSTIEALRLVDRATRSEHTAPSDIARKGVQGTIGEYRFSPDGEIEGVEIMLKRIEKGVAVPLQEEAKSNDSL